jgi:hypothetical protein
MALTINTQRMAVDDVDFSEKASSKQVYTNTRKPVTTGLNGVSGSTLTASTTTGWSTTGSVSLSLASGTLNIAGSGGSAPNGVVSVALDTIPGNYYLFCADKSLSSSISSLTMSVATLLPASPFSASHEQGLIKGVENITASYTDKRITFQAVSDITYLNFNIAAQNTGAYARIDSISLMDLTLPNNLEVTSVNGRAQAYNSGSLYNIGRANETSNSGYTVMSDGFVKYLHFPNNDLVLYVANSTDYGVHGDGTLFIEGVLK